MSERMPFQRIDVLAAKDLIQRDDVLVLDVRTPSRSAARISKERAMSLSPI